MKKFSETNIGRIGNLLKNDPNKSYTIKDISLGLKINPKSVSSSLSRLKAGKNKTGMINGRKRILKKKNGQNRKTGYEGFKIGTVKNTSKGRWEYLTKSKYVLWEVSFKVIDTNTKARQTPWVTEKMVRGTNKNAMDLHADAEGIAPSYADAAKMVEVAANRLFEVSLDVIKDTWGLIMFESLDPEKNITLASRIMNPNPLDENYNQRWDGMVSFKGSHGFEKSAKVDFNIDENRY
jgi:hypothetical protein